mmetsp:Transcript_7862/g.9119  ORF Transcript_7862/g.9119 Transcript_7862/m.9119 type:complete len:580 (+) Transcript_7862:437-2176(+)
MMMMMRLVVADRSLLWWSTTLLVLGVVQLLATKSSVALAVNPLPQPRGGGGIGMGGGGGSSTLTSSTSMISRGGSTTTKSSTATGFYKEAAGKISSTLEVASMAGNAELVNGEGNEDEATDQNNPDKPPMHILFLSADTGGGHRASAEALAKQFLIQYPGSTYKLVDIWTDHGCLPYRTLVNTYKRMSSNPLEWRIFYHLSNTKLNEVCANLHTRLVCFGKIKRRLLKENADLVVSVHPTMNHVPLKVCTRLSKDLGKHIPFFTVVTDLGSAHCMWFERHVDTLYVASDRLYKLARRRGGTAPDKIFSTGLPIRHGFAEQAKALGKDGRTSPQGKEYQQQIRQELKIDTDKQCILVMGGGEGVGSLSEIVHQMYVKLTQGGVDATICVVCGRNEKLQNELATRYNNNQDAVDVTAEIIKTSPGRKRRFLRRLFRRNKKQKTNNEKESIPTSKNRGNVEIIPLGFLTNIPEYMVAADVLVTKAGPGTIAEAAAVGLPVMMTSFLPGQEAGNVAVVLESKFGEYNNKPPEIGEIVTSWLLDSTLLEKMSKAAMVAGNPYAADEIVEDIGRQSVAWMKLNQQ